MTSGGYIKEIKIPFSLLGIIPGDRHLLGLDITADDYDTETSRETKIAFNTTTNELWRDPTLMATVVLGNNIVSDLLSHLLTNLTSGLKYNYYEGDWQVLPPFKKIVPVQSGIVTGVNIGVRLRDERFAMKYSGFLNIAQDGFYKFSTISDDGSKLYIDGIELYSLEDKEEEALVRSDKETDRKRSSCMSRL